VRQRGGAPPAGEAVRLTQGSDAAALDALGAAYAESGDFARAIATAGDALALVPAANQARLREQIELRRSGYQSARPWRE
jgi:hypothetical protein